MTNKYYGKEVLINNEKGFILKIENLDEYNKNKKIDLLIKVYIPNKSTIKIFSKKDLILIKDSIPIKDLPNENELETENYKKEEKVKEEKTNLNKEGKEKKNKKLEYGQKIKYKGKEVIVLDDYKSLNKGDILRILLPNNSVKLIKKEEFEIMNGEFEKNIPPKDAAADNDKQNNSSGNKIEHINKGKRTDFSKKNKERKEKDIIIFYGNNDLKENFINFLIISKNIPNNVKDKILNNINIIDDIINGFKDIGFIQAMDNKTIFREGNILSYFEQQSQNMNNNENSQEEENNQEDDNILYPTFNMNNKK